MNNIISETVKEYWERSAWLTFLYVVLAQKKSRFSQEKRVHDKLALFYKVSNIYDKIEITESTMSAR